MLKKLETIKRGLELGLIDHEVASRTIQELEKRDREKDPLVWGKYYFKEKFSLPFCMELHRYLVDTAELPFTSTLAPRGHAKTTIRCFLMPIYLALVKPGAYKHFMNVQATATRAAAVNISIKHELENNELLIRDYGYQVNTKGKWTEKQFVIKNGSIFTAIGAGESTRGLFYLNTRPDWMACDDLYDEQCIENPIRAKSVSDWFWSTAYYMIPPGAKTCMHIQGTAINRTDLMHTLSESERWEFKRFQAIKDWDKETVLWSEYKTFDNFMSDRIDMGTVIFSREMQNELRDDATSIIKHGDVRFFNGVIPGDEVVKTRLLAVDPAAGEKSENDATGMAVVYITDHWNYYVMDARNERLSLNNNIKTWESMHAQHKFNEFRLEAISGFKGIAQEVRRRSNLPLFEIKKVSDKILRLTGVSPKFENHKVFINSKMNEAVLTELIYQLTTNRPTHDDIRDAIVLALEDRERGIVMV